MVGASTFFFNERRYANAKNYQVSYFKDTDTGTDSTVDASLYLATRLRYRVPIARQDFLDWFGDDVFARVYSKLKEFSAMGWIMLGDDWFMVSDRGCLVLDELIGHLDID